jgi:hypothetical protein
MALKIINTALILVAVFMGVKQGYAMFSGKTMPCFRASRKCWKCLANGDLINLD